VHSRGSSINRWNWIRAWNSAELVPSHSAARTVECIALRCSRVSWTPSYDELGIRVSRVRLACSTGASARLQALGQRAISMLKMTHFSFCKIAQSEPSRGGVGTWRWQVQSQAAPRYRWVRVQHEPTWIRNREQRPGRTCQPRTTQGSNGPASPARHHGGPASSSVQTLDHATGRTTARSNQAHNRGQLANDKNGDGAAWTLGEAPELSDARSSGTVRLDRAGKIGSRQRRKQF
jgi:hypothetical protein